MRDRAPFVECSPFTYLLAGRILLIAGALIVSASAPAGTPAERPAGENGLAGSFAASPLALSDELRAWGRVVASPRLSPARRVERLLAALRDPRQTGLEERRQPTLTAAEAFERRQVNCVSFAFLFVALAREAGVPAFFVLVSERRDGGREGNLRVVEEHLAAGVGLEGRALVVDFGGEVSGRGHVLRSVPDLTAISLYHSNLGVEALLEGRAAEAVAALRWAVALEPALPMTWVNLGVALRHTGELAEAESAYRRALELDPAVTAAYTNLAVLLDLRGESAEAAALLEKGLRLQEPDPFSYLGLARESLEAGRLEEARRHYQRALELSR